ncbi:hypothetical protein PYW07_009510 [Mythimna separata]|uniref:Uncharacterized protein n=1 Tax=Mythimna separata TaxID=271217 RepID=A0AAD7YC25_MYTSE|nr:hypothetical protein PYW07_009510 [Mythimna separata]
MCTTNISSSLTISAKVFKSSTKNLLDQVKEKLKKMKLLCIALLLTVAIASVASNVAPEVHAMPGVAKYEDSELNRRGSPIETVPEPRDNLSEGTIGDGDRVIAWINYSVGSSFFVTHDQEVTVRGFDYTNITAIRVIRVANSPTAFPTITSGGIGYNDVTIRLVGQRQAGFEYIIQVYAAVGCQS